MSTVIIKALLKLWNAWNIRVLIIVSLALQIFLNLTAQMRKQCGAARKFYFRWPFWLAYLSADWIAMSAIGAIMVHSKGDRSSDDDDGSPRGDILMFWAPFLLLHLGGPDNITSYTLEDNGFWKRHLFQVLLQVGFTVFSIANLSTTNSKLLVPTILMLISGIIKYGERNIAFYSASLDHFGDKWLETREAEGEPKLPIPKQFQLALNGRLDQRAQVAVKLFGILQRLLVGPLLDQIEVAKIKNTFDLVQQNPEAVLLRLRVMEIELSLLYEVLHTKLPVVDSKVGWCSRLVSLGCAVAAFSLFMKMHNIHLVEMTTDVCLTYVLLIGAIGLDLVSVLLLILNSDWVAICHFQNGSEILDKQRWSNTVSQSNLITFHVKEYSGLFKNLADFPIICNLFQAIKEFRCVSSEDFDHNHLWSFIVEQVDRIGRDPEQQIQQVWLFSKRVQPLRENELLKNFESMDYTRSLLALHVATELCFQEDIRRNNPRVITEQGRVDYRAICKQLSDYMFYLAVTKSAMMSPLLDNWELELQYIMDEMAKILNHPSNHDFSDETLVCRKIFDLRLQIGTILGEPRENDVHRLPSAVKLAKDLMDRPMNDWWMVMSQILVEFMCYAAINCNPDVHARQLSQGGELLTLVWLLMNHSGLVLRSYKTLAFDDA